MSHEMTVEELFGSLTGFDEIAIETHLGFDIYEIASAGKGVKALRAAVFVAKTREGLNAPEAKAAALGMSSTELQQFFHSDPEEIDPDAPETAVGKDSSQPA